MVTQYFVDQRNGNKIQILFGCKKRVYYEDLYIESLLKIWGGQVMFLKMNTFLVHVDTVSIFPRVSPLKDDERFK